MRLRYRRASQTAAPVVIVALRAGKVELALSKLEDFPAAFDKGTTSRIVGDGRWLSFRLMRHVSGQCQQVLMFKRQRCDLLMLAAAPIDALLQIDRPADRSVECRISRRYRLHAWAKSDCQVRFGRPGRALNRPTWSPVKGSPASLSPNRLSCGCPTTIFRDPRN